MVKDLYQILGIPEDANETDIRTAYRTLAKRYHPDVGATSSASRFREIQEAYDTLSDPARRAAYDRDRPNAGLRQTLHRQSWHGSQPEDDWRLDPSHLDLTGIFDRPKSETIGRRWVPAMGVMEAQSVEWPDLDEILRLLQFLDDPW